MKRIKSKVFCEKKGKYRIAFKTRERADFFIEHCDEYMENIDAGLKPIRSFYCTSCQMWHITHFPLSPESEHAEERDRMIQELEVLTDRLKKEFRNDEWKVWKQIVSYGIMILDKFRGQSGFENLVENAGKQLEHCEAIIKICEAKENGLAEEQYQRARKAIEQKTKSLDYYGFEEAVKKLKENFSDECMIKALAPSRQDWIKKLSQCVEDEWAMDNIHVVMKLSGESIPDSREVELEDLYIKVDRITKCMDYLYIHELPRNIWDLLRSKAKKISNVLEFCFSESKPTHGPQPMDRIYFNTSLDLLEEASDCIDKGEKELALNTLQYVDTRIGKLPFNGSKIDLMDRLCRIGRRYFDLKFLEEKK